MSDPPSDSAYVHGTAPEEQGRLSRLNQLINDLSLRELALRGGEHVLDLGSGLGQFTRAMARAVGKQGRVVGVERSPEQMEMAKRLARHEGEEHLLDQRQGDALALKLDDSEWGSFDVAFARFLLEHVAHPQAVVNALVRAVKPGGRIVLADDDHDVLRLYPEPVGVMEVWRAYMRTYHRHGNDPFVGRRLVALLHGAGAVPARNTWLFFGGCSGHPDFLPLVQNMAEILSGAREAIVSGELLGADAVDQGVGSLRRWGERPDAALWFSICWAEGRRA